MYVHNIGCLHIGEVSTKETNNVLNGICGLHEWPSSTLSSVVTSCFIRYQYGLLTKCEVKMAGYWASSFFTCLWSEMESRSINLQKKNKDNIQPS